VLLPTAWVISRAEVPIGTSEQDVAFLRARVATSLANEQQLATTNAQLHSEINSWVEVGRNVLNREAQIIQDIKRAGAGADQPSLRAAVLAGWSAPKPKKQEALALATISAKSHSLAVSVREHLVGPWHIVLLIVTVLAAVAVCMLKADTLHWHAPFRMPKRIQISELQLEGATTGFGEGYLLLESGGLKFQTRSAAQKGGSCVLRFDEVLVLNVGKRSGPCTFTVFRSGEHQDMRIGTVSLEAIEIRHCVEGPGQYFHFDVQTEANLRGKELRIACRISELEGMPAKQQARNMHPHKGAHVV